jgi:drug/metabolite transporter (DMT)-like permease
MTDNSILIDVIGWIGAISILVAYALVSTRKLEGNSIPYQLLNLAGGACLIVNTIYYRAYPSTFVNLVWAGIAICTIVTHGIGKPMRGSNRTDRHA